MKKKKIQKDNNVAYIKKRKKSNENGQENKTSSEYMQTTKIHFLLKMFRSKLWPYDGGLWQRKNYKLALVLRSWFAQ